MVYVKYEFSSAVGAMEIASQLDKGCEWLLLCRKLSKAYLVVPESYQGNVDEVILKFMEK